MAMRAPLARLLVLLFLLSALAETVETDSDDEEIPRPVDTFPTEIVKRGFSAADVNNDEQLSIDTELLLFMEATTALLNEQAVEQAESEDEREKLIEIIRDSKAEEDSYHKEYIEDFVTAERLQGKHLSYDELEVHLRSHMAKLQAAIDEAQAQNIEDMRAMDEQYQGNFPGGDGADETSEGQDEGDMAPDPLDDFTEEEKQELEEFERLMEERHAELEAMAEGLNTIDKDLSDDTDADSENDGNDVPHVEL